MSEAEILVSGATGRTGGAAVDELLKLGKSVRAYVRSDDERAAALRSRGVDIAVGDFTDIDQIRAAMEGIQSAYFLYPIAPGIIGAAAYFAQAAKEAGVGAIVNMSQISARRESASHAAQDHWISVIGRRGRSIRRLRRLGLLRDGQGRRQRQGGKQQSRAGQKAAAGDRLKHCEVLRQNQRDNALHGDYGKPLLQHFYAAAVTSIVTCESSCSRPSFSL